MLLLLQSHLSTRILPSSPMLPSFLLPRDYVSDGCRELKGVDGKIASFSSFERYCSQSWGRQNKRKHTSQKNKRTTSRYGLPLSARCPVRKVYKAKQFGHCSPGLPPLEAFIPQVPVLLSRKGTSPLHGLCTLKLPGLKCGHHTDSAALLLWKDSSLFLAL